MSDNFTLRDQIREYWSMRAAAFDEQPGHGIRDGAEKQAWMNLLRREIGDPKHRKTLDLASGTGEISHLLHDYGLQVTGLDWSDAMLEIARQKAKDRGSDIKFLTGDAENTREPEGSYDLIVNRHLVWTLVDPAAAFKHWYGLLKPGGILLIIDGDFNNKNLLQRGLKWLSTKFSKAQNPHGSPEMSALHQSIQDQLYFRKGARRGAIDDLLKETGFSEINVSTDLRQIKIAQAGHMDFFKGLERRASDRYVIRAAK
jgi:ubiquinone/menaquinone biosynthesis C-methylase UbiE